MTISNTTVKQRFTGNGTTDTFAIPFSFQSNSEIKVYLRDENVDPVTETLLTLTTDYTLSGSPAANVVMITPPAVGEFLVIDRDTTLVQSTDYIETGVFPAVSHENALDKLTQQAQELNEAVSRAFKVSLTSTFSATSFPDPDANQLIGWNAGGTALENIDPSSLTLIGVGDVIGPASSTDNAAVRYDSTTGKLVQDSGVTISDTNVVNGITQLNVDNIRVDGSSITSTDLNGDINITPNGTGDIVLDGLNWPQADGLSGTFLTTNGTGQLSWSAGAAGDVSGPGASTLNAVPRFGDTGGNTLLNSGILVDASDNMSGVNQLGVGNLRLSGNEMISLDTNGDIEVTPDGTGDLILDGIAWPQTDGAAGQALHTDGSGQAYWDTALTGDVVGPASAVDNEIPRYDSTTGKLIQGSGAIISDTGVLSGLDEAFIGELYFDNSYITPSTPGASLDLIGNAPTSYVRFEGVAWPKTDGTAGQVLTTDGTGFTSWATAAGTGDVTGPGGATDNAVARYDGVTGLLLQDSVVLIDDVGVINGVTQLNVDNIRLDGNSIISTDTNGDLILTPDGTGDLVLDGLNWPQADGALGNVLSTDGAGQLSWSAAGSGDVVGPASSTDNALARFDLATGKLLQDSVGILTDAGALSGLTQLDVDNLRLDGNTISSTDVNGDLILTPNGTGDLVLDGLNWPQADGTIGQVLETNGAGQLSWATPSGGGGSSEITVTAGENLAAGDAIYISVGNANGDTGRTQGSAYKLDATNDERMEFVGFTTAAILAAATGTVSVAGEVTGLSGLTIGEPFWASITTPGAVQVLAPIATDMIWIIQLGVATSATTGTINAAASATAIFNDLTPSITGDVVGPASSTDNAVTRFDSTTGKLIQNSVAILDDAGALSGLTQLDVDNLRLNGNSLISTDTNGDVVITPDGTGDVVIDGLNWPQADGAAGTFLTTNGTGQLSWGAAGAGDVVGPASSTDNALARFDLATGKLIQDSVAILSDAGALSGVTQLDVDNVRVDGNSIVSTDVNGDLVLTPNGTGDLVLDGLNWPQSDGSAGQVLETNGSGQLSWTNPGGGGGGGSGSEFGDIIQSLGEEELNNYASLVPGQIIDAFNNDDRGTKVDMSAVADALRFDAGEFVGSYNRKQAGSVACTSVTGVVVHSPQALAPKNGQTVPMNNASQSVIFSGDLTDIIQVNKNIIIAKFLPDSDPYADGFNRYQFLNDGTVVYELEVTAASYNAGTDETTITVDNIDSVNLAQGLATNDLNEQMRVIPWDYAYKARTDSGAALETMSIQDAFLSDFIRLAGENFFQELFNITGTIRMKAAQCSPSKQYWVVKIGEWDGATIVWHFGYSVDYGRTWTKFGTTKPSFRTPSTANTQSEEHAGNFFRTTPDSLAVDDNGNAFWTYNVFTGNHAIDGVYSDLTAGTPVLTDTPVTGSDGGNNAGATSGVIGQRTDLSDEIYCGGVTMLDGYVAVIIANANLQVVYIRWYSSGGATHVGISSTSYSHDIVDERARVFLSGTSPNRRTHLITTSASDTFLHHIYWDEGSLTAVANNAITNTASTLIGASIFNDRGVVFYTHNTNAYPIYEVTGTVNGTPAWASPLTLFAGTATITSDWLTGWNTASRRNLQKVSTSNVAQNPLDENHVLAGMDLIHSDGRTKAILIEIPDITDTNLSGIVNFSVATTTALRSASTGERKGQTFVATSATPFLRTVSFWCYQLGQVPAGNTIKAELFATSSGLPTGAALAESQTIDPSKLTKDTLGQWIHFNFNSIALTNTVEYAIVITGTYPISASNHIVFNISGSNEISGGSISFDGSIWTSSASNDHGIMISNFWITELGKCQNNLAGDIGDWAFHDQETQIVNIDSNSAQFSHRRTNHHSGAFRELSGHVYRRVITYGNGTNQSVYSNSIVAGYAETNHDPYLVFNVAYGTDECKAQNISTGILDDNSCGEDRSGMLMVTNSYDNISSADIAVDSDFQEGLCLDFNGTDERIGYVDRSQFDLYYNKPFIFEFEIKTSALSGLHHIITQYNSGASYGWIIKLDAAGSVLFSVYNSSGTLLSDVTTNTAFITNNTYYRVRIVYNGDNLQPRIYKATTSTGSFTEASSYSGVVNNFGTSNTSSGEVMIVGSISGSAGTYAGKIGYIKIANGVNSFIYDGFKSQPPTVSHVNLGTKIIAENKVGQNSTTSGVNFDNIGIIDDADDASVVDSYDVIAQYQHTIAGTAGNEFELELDAGRESDRDQSSIQGINFRFSR